MPAAKPIDEIDAKILRDLLIDGRKEFTEIAKEAGVSKDIIWQHYTNMKKRGIITGATIQLNYASVGYNIAVFFYVHTPPKGQKQVVEQLQKIPGIYREVYQFYSPTCVWAISDFMKAEQLEPTIQRIKKLPEVTDLEVDVCTGQRNMPENLSLLHCDERTAGVEQRWLLPTKRTDEVAYEIDEVDRKIIEKLNVNGRASFNSIGKELGISTSSVINRYNELKHNGIIRVLIQINPFKIGYAASACFRIKVDSKGEINGIAEKVALIPDVIGVIKTTGACDLTIFAEIKDFEHLFAIESEMANIEGIKKIASTTLTKFAKLPYPREHMSTF